MDSTIERLERIAAEASELAAALTVALEVSDEQIATAFCQGQGRWGTVTNDEWPGYLRGAQSVRALIERAVLAEREACAADVGQEIVGRTEREAVALRAAQDRIHART